MLSPGLVSVTFRQLSVQEIVKHTVKAGLKGIEWGGDIHVPHGNLKIANEARKVTEEAGLKVTSYGSYYRIGHSETEGLYFEQVLETAIALNAPVIRVWAGKLASAQADVEYKDIIVNESRRLADLAASAGITLAYEFHANTLTDTNASAWQLLKQVNHEQMMTYWQPPVGKSPAYCQEGLELIKAKLCHIHVYHWGPGPVRYPLAEGEQEWQSYLAIVKATGKPHFCLLEFVKDNHYENFYQDALTLKSWLAGRAANSQGTN